MNKNVNSYDDAYCLLEIRKGNEFFFNLIFERYRNNLFNYLFKILKSKEVSEEIVLDVFLKLWEGRAIITEIQNFEAFIYKVAYNKAIDFFRAAKRSPSLQEAIWDVISQAPSSEKADSELLVKNMNALINEAVNLLSPQRKLVFELRNKEGLSYSEIAEKLQLSTNTVRNHLNASTQFIKEYLERNNTLVLPFAYFFIKFLK